MELAKNITDNKTNEKKLELTNEDIQNIKLIMEKHDLDEETTKKIYFVFNKNVISVLKYISNEIDNLKIICNQTAIDIEKAREIYYNCNKDVVESISFILEEKEEKISVDNGKNETKEEEIKIPIFNEGKIYKHIIEYGKDLLHDEENGYLFDAESKIFFTNMKSVKTKIHELRYIVDSKDVIIQNQKKTGKKEQVENILNTYHQKLIDWGKSQIEKWENDESLRKEYVTKDKYQMYLEKQIKLKFANETSKYY